MLYNKEIEKEQKNSWVTHLSPTELCELILVQARAPPKQFIYFNMVQALWIHGTVYGLIGFKTKGKTAAVEHTGWNPNQGFWLTSLNQAQ